AILRFCTLVAFLRRLDHLRIVDNPVDFTRFRSWVSSQPIVKIEFLAGRSIPNPGHADSASSEELLHFCQPICAGDSTLLVRNITLRPKDDLCVGLDSLSNALRVLYVLRSPCSNKSQPIQIMGPTGVELGKKIKLRLMEVNLNRVFGFTQHQGHQGEIVERFTSPLFLVWRPAMQAINRATFWISDRENNRILYPTQ